MMHAICSHDGTFGARVTNEDQSHNDANDHGNVSVSIRTYSNVTGHIYSKVCIGVMHMTLH